MTNREISQNFQFLEQQDIAKYATSAEQYCLSDPETAHMVARKCCELIAKYALSASGYTVPKKTPFYTVLNKLRQKNIVGKEIFYLFTAIRKYGNLATHESLEVEPIRAFKHVRQLHKIAVWYHYKFSLDKPEGELPRYQIPMETVNKVDDTDTQKAFSVSQQIRDYVDSSDELQNNLAQIASRTISDPSILDEQLSREDLIKEKIEIIEDFVSSSDDDQSLSSGEIIRSRYKIGEKLGSGSFGVTYIAEDLDKPNNALCVVKELSPSMYSSTGRTSNISERAKNLFNQEASVLSQIKHPEIPSLQAFFEERGRFFIVQDYIAGYTLAEELSSKIESNQKWEEKDVLGLVKDILSPLKYIHDKSLHGKAIVHRDVKPDNLIRRADDNKIVLIDFGAVKQIVDESNSQGSVMGTRGYMSPEQQTRGYILPSCDVYAVGIIAIEALYGKRVNDLDNSRTPYQLVTDMDNISSEFKAILLKMICDDYKDRYANAIEAFDTLVSWEKAPVNPSVPIQSPPSYSQDNKSTLRQSSKDFSDPFPDTRQQQTLPKTKISSPKQVKPTKSKKKLGIPILISCVVGVFTVGLGIIYSLPYLTSAKLSKTEITIGTLWKPEDLQGLADFLEAKAVPENYFDFLQGKKVKVRINGDSTLAYQEAEKRMESKQWDIAFTNSPILSVSAKENNYRHITGMFPNSSSYQAGLFVRADSNILSLKDIQANTRVGLGSFSSASSFYMPVYDLYGKSITANVGNRGTAIIKLVKEGKVDVGSAAIGDSIRKDDPTIRIIHVSRDIPGAGVYASPNLSASDYEQIRQLMLNAPQDIREKANYGDKPEPDYTEFQKISQRVEEILVCADFSKSPVFLGCNTNVLTFEGVINSASVVSNEFIFKFSASNTVYNIKVNEEIVQKIFGSNKLTDIQGMSVVVKVQEVGSNNSIVITQPTQLRVVQKKMLN